MKYLLTFLIISTSICYAQDEHYSINAHLGYGLSNSMFNGGSTELKPTYNAGVEIRRQLGQKGLFLQTGLRWNEYGYRDRTIVYISNNEHNGLITVNYKETSFFLTLPIITTYKFEKALTGLTFSVGPQVSFDLFSKYVYGDDVHFGKSYSQIVNLAFYSSVGYEHNIGKNWIIGTEIFSNLIPKSVYNFGVGLSSRYILKTKLE